MKVAAIRPSPSAAQALRERLAELSADNTWLRRRAEPGPAESASSRIWSPPPKAAAVVETLDEIAESNRDEFRRARKAFFAPKDSRTDIRATEAIRNRHAVLYELWRGRKVTPPQVQAQLLQYYADRGRRQLDERFFHCTVMTPRVRFSMPVTSQVPGGNAGSTQAFDERTRCGVASSVTSMGDNVRLQICTSSRSP